MCLLIGHTHTHTHLTSFSILHITKYTILDGSILLRRGEMKKEESQREGVDFLVVCGQVGD